MARGREGVAKRERERLRQERQEAKRERRETMAVASTVSDDRDEASLMDEFRTLSERHAAGEVSEATYAAERVRIFGELGIEGFDS